MTVLIGAVAMFFLFWFGLAVLFALIWAVYLRARFGPRSHEDE